MNFFSKRSASGWGLNSMARTTSLCAVIVAFSISAFANNQKTLQQAQKALRAGDFERAEQLYRELLQKDDRDFRAHLGLSKVLLKERRLPESFEHAARVIAADPLSAEAHAVLGLAILGTGDFRLSLEEFRTALNIDDDQAMAVGGLAMIDFYENRTAAAIDKLRRAVSMDPGEPDYIFSLGQAAARAERYQEAADAYERFLTIAPRTDADRRARIRGLIDFLRYLGHQNSLYTVSGPERTVLTFESIDNRPIVKLRLNGSKNFLRFVLDTGSGMSVISEETARKLGLHPIARGGMARAIGGGGRFEIVYGCLNSMDLGEMHIENIPVYIRRFYDVHTPVDGYLGIAALVRLVTAVDYGTRRMTLVRQRNTADLSSLIDRVMTTGTGKVLTRPGFEIPVRTTSSGFLSGEVTVDGVQKSLNFIIDTGATVSVISQRAAEIQPFSDFIQPDRMRVFGAAGVTEDVKVALLPKLAIGNYAREKVNVAVLDLDPINETAGFQQNGILGGNFLRHFRVVFDFQRAILRFEPTDALNSTAAGTQETSGK
jgi:predicted aspartyl protease/thioredoxin-like negative regulator of GroEL